jgi:hypothetical protein
VSAGAWSYVEKYDLDYNYNINEKYADMHFVSGFYVGRHEGLFRNERAF